MEHKFIQILTTWHGAVGDTKKRHTIERVVQGQAAHGNVLLLPALGRLIFLLQKYDQTLPMPAFILDSREAMIYP